jgi:hypothetical protein
MPTPNRARAPELQQLTPEEEQIQAPIVRRQAPANQLRTDTQSAGSGSAQIAAPRPLSSFGQQGSTANAPTFGRIASTVIQPKLVVGSTDDPLEREADAMADQVVGRVRRAATVDPSSSEPVIRRNLATSERVSNSAEQSARAKKGWGKIGSVVEKSKEFNAGTNPFRKAPGDSDKTTTAGGAWLASQVNSKEKIGSVDEYMGSRDDPNSKQSKHLEQFLGGGHAFITVWHHKNFFNLNEDGSGWGGWGQDANFIAPLGEADQLVADAAADGARGIWDLEVALGIPTGSWVSKCAPNYSIYRYKVHKPAELNMRIPSGNESGAYASWWDNQDNYQAGQWQPRGRTEGGAAEAVIDKISLAELQTIGKDVLEIVEDTSLAANTRRVVAEQDAAKARGSSDETSDSTDETSTPTYDTSD